MTPFFIREIQKNDNIAIANVIRTVFIEDNFPKTGTAFEDVQLNHLFEFYSEEKSIYYVIEKNGEIVGGAGVKALQNADNSICELQKMYLLTAVRGNGLGYEIINKCLEKAKQYGFKKCYLETLPTMKAAQNLYQKLGFEYLDEPLGCTGHSSCPVWMIKNL